MTADIRLIATDLDGTLIGSASELALYTAFRDRINDLRRTNDVVWAACTGRTLRSFRSFFRPMRMMGLVPDFVIIRHAYIYGMTMFGYMPHLLWNLHINYLLWLDRFAVKRAINEWLKTLIGGCWGITTVRRKKDRVRLRFDSAQSARVGADLLREKVRDYRQLRVFEYLGEVDVRPVPHTKGLAVTELARHLGIGSENILAIGNGHNDISMLEGDVAGLTGCPANSEAEVIEVVHRSDGHIASKRSLSGVMEILDAYMTGSVRSDLPDKWNHRLQRHNPESTRSLRDDDKPGNVAGLWLAIVVVYAVLVVFASFDLLPFSGIVMMPFSWLVSLILRVMGLFRG